MARIVIIEDNPLNLKLEALVLRKAGHEVAVATNATDGLALIARERPDAVLMDIQMPGMDGLEATCRLRADPANATLIILAVSACALPDDARLARAAGCDGYMVKPVHRQDLLAALDGLLATRGLPGS